MPCEITFDPMSKYPKRIIVTIDDYVLFNNQREDQEQDIIDNNYLILKNNEVFLSSNTYYGWTVNKYAKVWNKNTGFKTPTIKIYFTQTDINNIIPGKKYVSTNPTYQYKLKLEEVKSGQVSNFMTLKYRNQERKPKSDIEIYSCKLNIQNLYNSM